MTEGGYQKKTVIRVGNSYCYACISENQALLSWRLDLYNPQEGTHFATFIDEETYFDCLNTWNSTNEEIWKKALSLSTIDFKNKLLFICNHQLSLFQVYKQIRPHKDNSHYLLELVDFQNQLSCLVLCFRTGELTLIKVDDFSLSLGGGQFKSSSASRGKLALYSNLMTKLYHQWMAGVLPASKISTDLFQSGE